MTTERPHAHTVLMRPVESDSELIESAVGLHHNAARVELSSTESNQPLVDTSAAEPPQEDELIQDPSRIASIVEALIVHEARGYVANSTRAAGRPPRKIPARATRDGRLLLECGSDAGSFPRPPFQVQLEGYKCAYQFRSSAEGTISTPESIRRVRRRSHRRVAAPRRLRVTFAHPSLPDVVTDAPAIDVSLE